MHNPDVIKDITDFETLPFWTEISTLNFTAAFMEDYSFEMGKKLIDDIRKCFLALLLRMTLVSRKAYKSVYPLIYK